MIFRRIYSLLVYLLLPLALLKLWWRGFGHQAYRQHIGERFGKVTVPAQHLPYIWIHAVSVGETIAISPLVYYLLQHFPNYGIWFTVGTINGRARAQALFGDRVQISYIPYDTPIMVARFLNKIKPCLTIIMETEVWPNMLRQLERDNIPVLLANARLSERSFRRYQRFSCFFKEAWPAFTIIAANAEADAKRYIALGIDPGKVQHVENLKYNLMLPNDFNAIKKHWQNLLPYEKIWMAASTHEDEEQQLLVTFATLRKHWPQMLWVLAPRHPERVPELARSFAQQGFQVVKRSEISTDSRQPIKTDILIIDTMGEMLLFYALSQVAFVGGSLIKRGGHNVLEPAAVGTAITAGPWTFNFATIVAELLRAKAMIQCQGAHELAEQTYLLFAHDSMRSSIVDHATQLFQAKQNSLPQHVALIETLLKGDKR